MKEIIIMIIFLVVSAWSMVYYTYNCEITVRGYECVKQIKDDYKNPIIEDYITKIMQDNKITEKEYRKLAHIKEEYDKSSIISSLKQL